MCLCSLNQGQADNLSISHFGGKTFGNRGEIKSGIAAAVLLCTAENGFIQGISALIPSVLSSI